MQKNKKLWFNPWVMKNPLEEGMATHSSLLAWDFPWTEEPGGLQSMGSQRVGQDWSDLAHASITGNTAGYKGMKIPACVALTL